MNIFVNFFKFFLFFVSLINLSLAANCIDLKNNGIAKLRALINPRLSQTPIAIKEKRRDLDFNRTLHIRAQQLIYQHPVWDSHIIIHIPQVTEEMKLKSLNQIIQKAHISLQGHVYENLALDLSVKNLEFLEKEQLQHALNYILKIADNATVKQNAKAVLMVYIDKNHKAHWAYLISYFFDQKTNLKIPTFIIDALSFKQYEYWNDIKTYEPVRASGIGGNPKTNYVYYDSQPDHYPALTIDRDPTSKTCFLQNENFILKDFDSGSYYFPCDTPTLAGLFQVPDESINGAYSPRNDVMFHVDITKKMFNDWYKINFDRDEFILRKDLPSAFYYENIFYIGMGDYETYPYSNLDTIAHELSHKFTTAHSNLTYNEESGAINEAFSDMAAKAVEFYLKHKNDWNIGMDIRKNDDHADRFFDPPSKNCQSPKKPGEQCSIDNLSQYHPNMEVHFASGIFDRIFYLIATAPNWNTQKAFNVMVKANMHYWKENSNFQEAACGILSAAKDYRYELAIVENAIKLVGLDNKNCPT